MLAEYYIEMLFGRRKKKPNDRVLDLKARVDALRAADEATRKKPYSLDHFLEGDDVLTGRSQEDDYKPVGFDASVPVDEPAADPEHEFEVDLQAELEKYIRRQEELSGAGETSGSVTPSAPARPQPDLSFGSGPSTPSPQRFQPVSEASSWPTDDSAWAPPEVNVDAEGESAPGPSAGRAWDAEEQWRHREDEAV